MNIECPLFSQLNKHWNYMTPKNNLPYRNKAKSSDVVCYAFLNTINTNNELKRNISPISLMPFQKKIILEISNQKISTSFTKAYHKTNFFSQSNVFTKSIQTFFMNFLNIFFLKVMIGICLRLLVYDSAELSCISGLARSS